VTVLVVIRNLKLKAINAFCWQAELDLSTNVRNWW